MIWKDVHSEHGVYHYLYRDKHDAARGDEAFALACISLSYAGATKYKATAVESEDDFRSWGCMRHYLRWPDGLTGPSSDTTMEFESLAFAKNTVEAAVRKVLNSYL